MLHRGQELHVLNHVIDFVVDNPSYRLSIASTLIFVISCCASLQIVLGNYLHGEDFLVLLIHAELYFTVRSCAECLLYDVLVDSFDPGVFVRCDSAGSSDRVKPLSSLLNLTRDVTRI